VLLSRERRTSRLSRNAVGTVALAAALALVAAGVANLTTSEPDAQQATAYLNAGIAAQQHGHADDAREDYRRALAHDPGNKLGYYHLASLEQQQGQDTLAEEDYRAVLYFDSSYVPAYLNLGFTLHSLGRDDEARTEFAAAVRIDPSVAARIPAALLPPTP
jgi:Tfp pilus assembly protein PilF